ncbi:IQ domain-containing protein C [Candoia aspera]|uniref:IQ domain-containing protein C n=1 Tax=Candoia aspera TaxID=51853 RepID=UPI002FD7BF46
MREGADRQRLLAAVVQLQAHVRGYLTRKRLQSLRSSYESIVKAIEGSLDWFQWSSHLLPRPVFLSKTAQKSIKAKEFNSEEVEPQKQDTQLCQEELLSQRTCDFEMQLPSRLAAEVAAEPEVGEVGQSLERLVDAHPGNVCSLPGESEECRGSSRVSSDWSSTILGMESPRSSQEPHFPKAPEMPRAVPDLQNYRKHLAMELLWLQQAIVSRKKYLILKQRLGNPD